MTFIAEKVDNQLRKDVNLKPFSSGFLRIAFCLPELKPLQKVILGEQVNAAYIQQKNIATSLQSRGHRLTFIAPSSLDQIVCTGDPNDAKPASQTWSASRWFDFASRGTWRIQQLLGVPYLNFFSNYRFFDACQQCLPGHDLVYERNSLYMTGIAMACKRLGLPYVLFFDADQILELDFMGKPITGLLRWRAKATTRYNLNAADCVICVSEPAKAHLARNWSVPAEKIAVFPNAADVHGFRPDPEASIAVRTSLGVENKLLIFFVGGFYEWHDVRTLLDAFAQVLMTHPDACLVLVGDGTLRQAMEQHSTDLGIDHAVRFTGIVAHAEVPRLMAAADIAVVPYPPIDRELWLSPLKLFEYMASGTAIVASAVGQLKEIIQDRNNGLLVPPGDIAAMTVALHKLIDDPALRSRLSQQAREDAVQKYSWDSYVSRLERIFAAVIAGKPIDKI